MPDFILQVGDNKEVTQSHDHGITLCPEGGELLPLLASFKNALPALFVRIRFTG